MMNIKEPSSLFNTLNRPKEVPIQKVTVPIIDWALTDLYKKYAMNNTLDFRQKSSRSNLMGGDKSSD
jgi:hypothetical protein